MGSAAARSTTALFERFAGSIELRRGVDVLADVDRAHPVHPSLAGPFPQGVPRGSTVGCRGSAAVSMACLLAAGPSAQGRWVGILGTGTLARIGAQACHEAGVDLDRLVLVRPSRDPEQPVVGDAWCADVLGALVDGVDVVLVPATAPLRPATARRVQARAQRRGVLLVVVGGAGSSRPSTSREGSREGEVFAADLVVDADGVWAGLDGGAGHLRARQVQVRVSGRRRHRPVEARLGFPHPDGGIRAVDAAPLVAPRPAG
jgi:hypothetical protein